MTRPSNFAFKQVLKSAELNAAFDAKADLDPATARLLDAQAPKALSDSLAALLAGIGQPGGLAPLGVDGKIAATLLGLSAGANISIEGGVISATARGGGGGGRVYSRPAASGFQTDFGGADTTLTDIADGPLVLATKKFNNAGGSRINRAWMAAPAVDFTITTELTFTALEGYGYTPGLFLGSSTGKLQGMWLDWDGTHCLRVVLGQWQNPTTWDSNAVSWEIFRAPTFQMRAVVRQKAATDTSPPYRQITYGFSHDGAVWLEFPASSDTQFLGDIASLGVGIGDYAPDSWSDKPRAVSINIWDVGTP